MTSWLSAVRLRAAAILVALPLGVAACSTNPPTSDTAVPTGACPTSPVHVVVSVDQWGDIVSQLGGDCARVTTLLASSSVDPHDYEPSPADAVSFEGAGLIVVNGGHYDEWATKLAATSAPAATIISAATDSETKNPHVWYDPAAVTGLADQVTAELSRLAPDAAGYFTERRAAFTDAMKPYDAAIASIKAGAVGKSYAATEGVFDEMAGAVGLKNQTPAGYQASANNETDASPADLDAFLKLLRRRGVDVLIYNLQTEGSVPEQIRSTAQAAGVPVVEVTETVAPGAASFEVWQVQQLTALAEALGVSV